MKKFLLASINELVQKVTWPRYAVLQNYAILVVFLSIIFALFIGFIDFSWKNLVTWFYK